MVNICIGMTGGQEQSFKLRRGKEDAALNHASIILTETFGIGCLSCFKINDWLIGKEKANHGACTVYLKRDVIIFCRLLITSDKPINFLIHLCVIFRLHSV